MANNPFLWWLPTSEPAKDADTPAIRNKADRSGKVARKRSSEPTAAANLAEGHDKPGDLIRRAQQIAVAIFLEECAAFELTPVQHAALTAVRDNPGIDATRVAGIIAFDRTTISGVLERLESKGLIARTSNETDRRSKLLVATASGKALLGKVEPLVETAQDRILSPLNAKERSQLLALLAKLVNLNNDASRAPRRTEAPAAEAR